LGRHVAALFRGAEGALPLARASRFPNLPRFACAGRVIPLGLTLATPALRQRGRVAGNLCQIDLAEIRVNPRQSA
jgi:hypothetical protein